MKNNLNLSLFLTIEREFTTAWYECCSDCYICKLKIKLFDFFKRKSILRSYWMVLPLHSFWKNAFSYSKQFLCLSDIYLYISSSYCWNYCKNFIEIFSYFNWKSFCIFCNYCLHCYSRVLQSKTSNLFWN